MKTKDLYGILDDAQLRDYLHILIPDSFNVEQHADRLFKLLQSCHSATAGTGLDAFLSWSAGSSSLVQVEGSIREAWNNVGADNQYDVWYLASETSLMKNFSLKEYLSSNSKEVISKSIRTAIDGITTHADAELAVQRLAKIPNISPIRLNSALSEISKKSGIAMQVLTATYKASRAMKNRHSSWPHAPTGPRAVPLTFENFCYFIDLYRITIKLNLMTGRLHVMTPSRVASDWIPDARYDLEFMIGLMREAQMIVSQRKLIEDYAMRYASHPENIYHPVQAWLDAGECDGENHFEALIDSLDVYNMDGKITRMYISKWLLQSIEAIYEPSGIRSSVILILQGEAGIGKTRWIMNLIPENFQHEWLETIEASTYKAMLAIKNRNTDAVQHFESWICEVPDIDHMLRRSHYDSDTAKTDDRSFTRFLDRNVDKRGNHINYRRTSFIGTYSTIVDFVKLVSNRRYLVITLDAIDFQVQVDPLQLWLQVKGWYDQGVRHYMDIDEIRIHQQQNDKPPPIPPVYEPEITKPFRHPKIVNDFK